MKGTESADPTAGSDFTDDDSDDGGYDDMPSDDSDSSASASDSRPDTPRSSSRRGGDTPMLDKYGHDMTRAAEENRLDPVIGRDMEIERLAQILSRRKKNNPVVIGEPGVGKSAIVEGLALRIAQRKVPRVLLTSAWCHLTWPHSWPAPNTAVSLRSA